jgi:hypothetical protein
MLASVLVHVALTRLHTCAIIIARLYAGAIVISGLPALAMVVTALFLSLLLSLLLGLLYILVVLALAAVRVRNRTGSHQQGYRQTSCCEHPREGLSPLIGDQIYLLARPFL